MEIIKCTNCSYIHIDYSNKSIINDKIIICDKCNNEINIDLTYDDEFDYRECMFVD